MTAEDLYRPGEADDATLILESVEYPERFAFVYDRHAVEIHRYLARRLGPAIADDLLGETFLIAFQQRARYVPARADARPWLYGIATNLIRRHRRDEVRNYRMLQRTGVRRVQESHADSVVAAITAESLGHRLGRAITRLRRGDRDVLLLVVWEEQSYEEVAEALDIPVGTVRSRLSRARRKLREALQETDPSAVVTAEERSNG